MTEQLLNDMPLPQFGITSQPDSNNRIWLGLNIQIGAAEFNTFLCYADEYQDVARRLHKGIMDAGRAALQAQRKLSGRLVEATGGEVSAIVSDAKRRSQRS